MEIIQISASFPLWEGRPWSFKMKTLCTASRLIIVIVTSFLKHG